MKSELTWSESEVKLKDLKEYKNNPRRISKESYERLVNSIKEHGYHQRILVNSDNTIIGGHQRKKALKEAGFKDSDPIQILKPSRELTDREFKRLNIQDNGEYGQFDLDLLSIDFDPPELIELGVPEGLLKDLLELDEPEEEIADNDKANHRGNLRAKFLHPPFSIFDARSKWWMDRKKSWLSLGIKSELGRD